MINERYKWREIDCKYIVADKHFGINTKDNIPFNKSKQGIKNTITQKIYNNNYLHYNYNTRIQRGSMREHVSKDHERVFKEFYDKVLPYVKSNYSNLTKEEFQEKCLQIYFNSKKY